jgi:hypothetical protein
MNALQADMPSLPTGAGDRVRPRVHRSAPRRPKQVCGPCPASRDSCVSCVSWLKSQFLSFSAFSQKAPDLAPTLPHRCPLQTPLKCLIIRLLCKFVDEVLPLLLAVMSTIKYHMLPLCGTNPARRQGLPGRPAIAGCSPMLPRCGTSALLWSRRLRSVVSGPLSRHVSPGTCPNEAHMGPHRFAT